MSIARFPQQPRTSTSVLLALSAVVFFAATVSSLFAVETPPTENAKAKPDEHAYFGVIVDSAHPALAANLKDLLRTDQGLTVEVVAADSPAAKAGVKVHDILTVYDDQKLFSPDQFIKLVRSDRPGREVAFEYLREGKLQKSVLTLGKLDPSDFRTWTRSSQSQPFRFGHPDRIPRRFEGQPFPAAEWDAFESLTLKKLEAGKFHVELQILGKDRTSQKHVFEGTRDEIHAAVNADKSLKTAERAHLLRSLNLQNPGEELPYPHIWFEPGKGWFFEQPGGAFH